MPFRNRNRNMDGMTIHRDQSEMIGRGETEGYVQNITVEVSFGDKTRNCSMAEKIYDKVEEESRERWTEAILEKHALLKKLGIPTIPTMRYDEKEGSVIMTDLTRNKSGKEVASVLSVNE